MQSIGNFDADSAFIAFLKATNQKEITGEIFYVLIRDLVAKGIILSGDSPVELYVPGIGEGFQAQENAKATLYQISTGRNINISGTDISDSFVFRDTKIDIGVNPIGWTVTGLKLECPPGWLN